MKTHWKSYKEWVDSWIPYITRPRNCHNSVNVISYYYIVDLCNPLLSRREEVGIGGTSQTEMLNSCGFPQTLFHCSKHVVTILLPSIGPLH